eukprot:1146047-Pelagomonas_calceolata.AAC.1
MLRCKAFEGCDHEHGETSKTLSTTSLHTSAAVPRSYAAKKSSGIQPDVPPGVIATPYREAGVVGNVAVAVYMNSALEEIQLVFQLQAAHSLA